MAADPVIEAGGVWRAFKSREGDLEAVDRHRVRGPAGRDLRLPGSQRRWQDHHPPHAGHPPASDQRQRGAGGRAHSPVVAIWTGGQLAHHGGSPSRDW